MRAAVVACLLFACVAASFQPPMCTASIRAPLCTAGTHQPHAVVAMKTAAQAREEDVRKLVSSVTTFISKVSGQEAAPPTASDIEAYCEDQKRKIGLLMEEAAKLRACEDEMGSKVKWTDIDGNSATDAAWLK